MGVKRLYNSVEFDEPVELSWRCNQLEKRCGRESHTSQKGLGALMSWGPEKMLIRCSKESHHPVESWADGRPVEHQENKTDNADGHKSRGQNIAVMFGLQLPLTRKL